MCPSARSRRDAAEPVARPVLATSGVCGMTASRASGSEKNAETLSARDRKPARAGRWPGEHDPQASGLVLAAEDVADAGVVEHGVERVGDQRGDRQDLDLV